MKIKGTEKIKKLASAILMTSMAVTAAGCSVQFTDKTANETSAAVETEEEQKENETEKASESAGRAKQTKLLLLLRLLPQSLIQERRLLFFTVLRLRKLRKSTTRHGSRASSLKEISTTVHSLLKMQARTKSSLRLGLLTE